MADKSGIEWTEATWNPVAGCTPVSPGCTNCYAARMALRLGRMTHASHKKYRNVARRTRGGRPVFTGRVNLSPESLSLPKSWKRSRLIFVNSMSDLFHDQVPEKFIHRVFDVMEDCPQHTFQVLTKRAERLVEMANRLSWPSNIWIGTSVESSAYYSRVYALSRVLPAAVRFLSCEPLLGSLSNLPLEGIDWVIVGGESGPNARPIQQKWVLEIKERCTRQGVPFFFKQWGGNNKKVTGRLLEGRTWDELPTAQIG